MIEQYHGHTPIMRERLAFRELPSDETVRGLPPTRHRTNVGALLDDMAFENLVRERLAAADEALAYNRRLRSHIDLIWRLIRVARPRIYSAAAPAG